MELLMSEQDKNTLIEYLEKERNSLQNILEEARKNKDYGKSDEIREELKKKGYMVNDSKEGAAVKKII